MFYCRNTEQGKTDGKIKSCQNFFLHSPKKNLSCNNNSKNYCLFRCIVSVKMRYFPKEVGFNPIGSSSMTSKVKNGSIKGSFCWFKLLFHRFHFVLVSSKFPLSFCPVFIQVSSEFHDETFIGVLAVFL